MKTKKNYLYIMCALGSAHAKFDVCIEVNLLPFYLTSSVKKEPRSRPKYKSVNTN